MQDNSNPNFLPDSADPRTIDNPCLTLPIEGNNVIGVTSVGPSYREAYYSDYGVEQSRTSLVTQPLPFGAGAVSQALPLTWHALGVGYSMAI